MKTSRLFRTAAVLGAAVMFLFTAPTACNSISGVNDLSFEGTLCRSNGDCPPAENECQIPKCSQGTCVIERLDGTKTEKQVPGDCKVSMCDDGYVRNWPLDSDKLITPTDCDEERCEGGEVANMALPERSPCNTSGVVGVGVCDGLGQCLECLEDGDCPKINDLCSIVVCESDHRCRPHPVTDGQPLLDQQPGDCRKRVCDGAGNEVLRPDPTDVPDDGYDCTLDSCTGEMPIHTDLPKDTPCGIGLKCNAYGRCTGCNVDADCKPTSERNLKCGPNNECYCEEFTCQGLNLTCGVHGNGCGGPLDCNDGEKNGSEAGKDCGNVDKCSKCANGNACSSNEDCSSGYCVDGVCCSTACDGVCQSCTALGKGYPDDGTCGYVHPGQDPDKECNDEPATQCGLSGVCNGAGACAKYENGTACADATCNGSKYQPAGVCADGQCSVFAEIDCTTFGCDVDGCKQQCSSDSECSAGSYCTNGICRLKKQLKEECDNASACASGHCVDGVCCDNACTGACMACNVATSLGTCHFVPQNMPDISTCVMPKACDGSGVCKKTMGQPCGQNSECSSANCVDGFCCNTSCAETCRACNVLGSIGTCTTVPVGQPDGNTCQTPGACSGFGACLKGQGALCAIGSECSSGYCFDGVCCNSECKEACKACNVAGTAGTCTNVPSGQTDPGVCPAPKYCNGMGVCVQ